MRSMLTAHIYIYIYIHSLLAVNNFHLIENAVASRFALVSAWPYAVNSSFSHVNVLVAGLINPRLMFELITTFV